VGGRGEGEGGWWRGERVVRWDGVRKTAASWGWGEGGPGSPTPFQSSMGYRVHSIKVVRVKRRAYSSGRKPYIYL